MSRAYFLAETKWSMYVEFSIRNLVKSESFYKIMFRFPLAESAACIEVPLHSSARRFDRVYGLATCFSISEEKVSDVRNQTSGWSRGTLILAISWNPTCVRPQGRFFATSKVICSLCLHAAISCSCFTPSSQLGTMTQLSFLLFRMEKKLKKRKHELCFIGISCGLVSVHGDTYEFPYYFMRCCSGPPFNSAIWFLRWFWDEKVLVGVAYFKIDFRSKIHQWVNFLIRSTR